MPLPTLIKSGLSILLGDFAIKNSTKALSILEKHFIFRADEITKAYQDSYADAITAITVGLAAPEQKLFFVQKFIHSKVTRDFADPIEDNYFKPFLQEQTNKGENLRKHFITELNKLIKYKDQLFQLGQFTEEDLAALTNYQGSLAITDTLLEEMRQFATVDETLAAFITQKELFGKAILYFFHEIIRQDDRVAKTQAALQQEGLINGVENVFEKLDKAHEDVIETKGLSEQILVQLSKLMANQNLSSQIKPRDEFTQHNSSSLEDIQKVVLQFNQLSTNNPEYSRVSNMMGSTISSTGNLEQAEHFFKQAISNAQNPADKALAHFNLFQIYLRSQNYQAALTELQAAIELDSERYSLHDIHKGYYPIESFLGAGGMGCVLLCKNQNRLIKQERVVIKCFWETLKGDINEVFKEPFAMNDIAGDFVPKPLDYGYANNSSKERAYFVTEYIEEAIDGEAWLEKYGPMDLETTVEVGLQIAKGLQLAHDNGIYHLDLKPANLLLKQTKSGIKVKIIDFGLSQAGETTQTKSELSVFGQAVLGGTLDYAPPEQQSFARHCQPDAKNDIFAFGATMYRLCTHKIPRPFRERNLPSVPALRDLLCDCIEDERENRPNSAQELINQLEKIVAKPNSKPEPELNKGKLFEFETITVNAEGKITKREQKQAHYQTIDLDKDVILEMVYIPGGTFMMGSPETEKQRWESESPQHKVTIEPFYMSKYPITQAQWQAIMANNPSRFKDDNRPVEKVSWHEAVAFCKQLSEKTNQNYSLPTEAQWEYACRAGTTTPFYFGETITTDLANYDGNYSYDSELEGIYRQETTKVGMFPPNAFGLYDMHGNVYEWCIDPWHDDYYENTSSDSRFCLRSGSWLSSAWRVRSAYRNRDMPTNRNHNVGFRICRL